MNGEEPYPEESRSLDSLRHLRLMALLGDMIDEEGKVKTAETLGVNYRTLVRAVEPGSLTGRMSDALERILLSGGGSAEARQREETGALRREVEALDRRLGALEKEMRVGLEAAGGGVEILREEHVRELRQLGRRLAQLEARQSVRGIQGASEAAPAEAEKPAAKPAWRPYRDLVTLEPEPGEEQVYGDAAPLIVQWRQARAEFLGAKDKLSKAVTEERLRELEIELIDKHELTLPPAAYPWDRFDRRDEVRSRRQTVREVRADRARALARLWLRRVLTLGLWRN